MESSTDKYKDEEIHSFCNHLLQSVYPHFYFIRDCRGKMHLVKDEVDAVLGYKADDFADYWEHYVFLEKDETRDDHPFKKSHEGGRISS